MIIRVKYKGETDLVKRVVCSQNRVIVEGENLVKKHIKQGQGREGGIFSVEAPLQVSNVQVIDPVTSWSRIPQWIWSWKRHMILKVPWECQIFKHSFALSTFLQMEAYEVATESVKTSVVEEEEEGLPSHPLDEGAFFATPSSMELSQFFDGMDDDGNPRNSGAFNQNRENGRRPRLEKPGIPKFKLLNLDDPRVPPKDTKDEKTRNQEPKLIKQPNRPHSTESGLGRKKTGKGAVQKKPMQPQQKMKLSNNEDSVQMKLEAAKRKFHERYQEAENAKKQRTIQVMEIHELPKQNLAQRSQNTIPGSHNRQYWANGRRLITKSKPNSSSFLHLHP